MFFVLCIAAVIAIAWLSLMASAALSLRWSWSNADARPRLRLVMAVVPVLAGAVLLGLHLRFTVNQAKYDLSMPFVFPITFGLLAVIAWFRAREKPALPAPEAVRPSDPPAPADTRPSDSIKVD